ncbi:MAG: MFS transporter [Burkholderiales bacterium]|jgi:AAA family ATP:ADP antiporter|nr:MFS transporter [Burkholderiales bacterium]
MTPGLIPDRWLARIVAVRPGEIRALLWSFAYFFFLLAAYYVLRPVRDEMGLAGGIKNLPWLFTATFVVMLAVMPLFGALVARVPRQRFIPLVYHFFVANILIFWLLLTFKVALADTARVFFVWISVFNLFAVSVFWSFMADLYQSEQGKRLFGFIAAGGSAGALLGPLIAVGLAEPIGRANLLLIAALLLEAAVLCAMRLEAAAGALKTGQESAAEAARPNNGLGGGWIAGLLMVLRSPYLAGIALWVALLSLAGTFLYFQQANIVAALSDDPNRRIAIFARIDLAVSLLTIIVQFVVTGKIIRRFGAGPAAAFLPFVFAMGFLALALTPMLWVVIAFQAAQRAANFAISNPARELLFTVVDREEKYKAKYVIDNVVFRGGDAASGWLFNALRGFGMELGAISLATVPIALAWLALALGLGRSHERRAAQSIPPTIAETNK